MTDPTKKKALAPKFQYPRGAQLVGCVFPFIIEGEPNMVHCLQVTDADGNKILGPMPITDNDPAKGIWWGTIDLTGLAYKNPLTMQVCQSKIGDCSDPDNCIVIDVNSDCSP